MKRALDPPYDLLVELIWTFGLELCDCLKIRVKDLSPAADRLIVYRRGKPPAHPLQVPHHLIPALWSQRLKALCCHRQDIESGSAGVFLDDLPQGFQTADSLAPDWQYLFPAVRLTRIGAKTRRYHLHPSLVQSKLRQASADIVVNVTASRLRARTHRHPKASPIPDLTNV